MKKLIIKMVFLIDILLVPFVFLAGLLLKNTRRIGFQRLPFCKKMLLNIGVFPIRNHYYEPQFDFREMDRKFTDKRLLPGINWNVQNQLKLMREFNYATELENIPMEKTSDLEYYLKNDAFEEGDSEYWYQLIRLKKPKRIFEIGSGNSTLMAINAIKKNEEEDKNYQCKHICIEPYEMPWLEKTTVTVVREKVEDVDIAFFSELESDDILFIDSSHVIRPEGDVVFEYLELLPTLKKGVIVHVHDIFSPRNYPDRWLKDNILLWNEQYLLEGFLTHNSSWDIIGSLNYLHHNHYEKLNEVCPNLSMKSEPGSFYLQKNSL